MRQRSRRARARRRGVGDAADDRPRAVARRRGGDAARPRRLTRGEAVMKPSDSPGYVRSLELSDALGQKEKLARALAEAREQLAALKEEVEKLTAPPSTYGVYVSPNDDGTVNILAQGRKAKVNTHSSIVVDMLKPGQEVLLNEALHVIDVGGYEIQGEVVIVKERLGVDRALVTVRADDDKVAIIADPLRGVPLRIGDHL